MIYYYFIIYVNIKLWSYFIIILGRFVQVLKIKRHFLSEVDSADVEIYVRIDYRLG